MSGTEVAERKFYTQADAKGQLFELCRRVIETGAKVYVKDKGGFNYLTLSPTIKADAVPLVEVSAQRFKDNFSRFSYLIKDGFCFKLRLKAESRVVYARAHSSYRDPLSDVIQACVAQLRGQAGGDERDDDGE